MRKFGFIINCIGSAIIGATLASAGLFVANSQMWIIMLTYVIISEAWHFSYIKKDEAAFEAFLRKQYAKEKDE